MTVLPNVGLVTSADFVNVRPGVSKVTSDTHAALLLAGGQVLPTSVELTVLRRSLSPLESVRAVSE